MQWVIVALVEALDVVAIEALVTDLHLGTQRAHGRKFLDGEPDRLRCGCKATIAQRLSWPPFDWLKMKNPHSPSTSRNRHVCHGETRAD